MEWLSTFFQSMSKPAVSRASQKISMAATVSELEPEQLAVYINEDMPGEEIGVELVVVSVTNFCVARCYRMITEGTWITEGRDLDQNTGEV